MAAFIGERTLHVKDDDGLECDAGQTDQLRNVFWYDGRVGLRDDGDIHGRSTGCAPDGEDRPRDAGNSKICGHRPCGQPAIGSAGTSRPDVRNGYRAGSSQTNRYRI